MTRQKITPKGIFPYTEDEEKQPDAEQAKWEKETPQRDSAYKINKLERVISAPIEAIIASMDDDQFKRLDDSIGSQYTDLLKLRKASD